MVNANEHIPADANAEKLRPNASDLLSKIRNDVEADRLRPIDLAREANLKPTTLYTMLHPTWSNRAVENIEALAEAYERVAKDIPNAGEPKPEVAPAAAT